MQKKEDTFSYQCRLLRTQKGIRYRKSADGKYLAVANEKSSNVVLFGVSDGHLDYITQTQVGSPACLLFKGETP